MKVAIIDLGSNSARMNIVEIKDGNAVVLQNHRKIVRLSEGMGEEKKLQPQAVERTLETLKKFKEIIDESGVEKVRAIATAALRTATNRELLTEPLKEIGIEFEIIDGEKEAYYDYMAVVSTLEVDKCLIIDIGGASTEIIKVENGVNTDAVSIPMAAVNITEKYFSGTIAKDSEIENAICDFTDKLKEIEWLKSLDRLNVIGLGGTIRALAFLECKGDELHGYEMESDFVYTKCMELVKMPMEQRIQHEGLEVGRADIILGGVVPLISLMKFVNSPRLVTCVAGLREGVMYDIVKK